MKQSDWPSCSISAMSMPFQRLNYTTEQIRNPIVILNCSLQQRFLHVKWYWYVLFAKSIMKFNQFWCIIYFCFKPEEKDMCQETPELANNQWNETHVWVKWAVSLRIKTCRLYSLVWFNSTFKCQLHIPNTVSLWWHCWYDWFLCPLHRHHKQGLLPHLTQRNR